MAVLYILPSRDSPVKLSGKEMAERFSCGRHYKLAHWNFRIATVILILCPYPLLYGVYVGVQHNWPWQKFGILGLLALAISMLWVAAVYVRSQTINKIDETGLARGFVKAETKIIDN